MIKCDFHVHSTASDGNYTPTEVVNRAIKNNVNFLALTDHDSINGIDEAIEAAKGKNITFIPGIELSTVHRGESIHLIGLFKDNLYKSTELKDFLEDMREKRKTRALLIVERLKKYFNIIIDADALLSRGDETIARPHIAQAIIEAGYPYTFDYIFDNIIGDKCNGYVASSKISTEDGVKILKEFNAVVILAHPKLIKKTQIHEFISLGMDGLEVFYYLNTPKETKRFKELALKNGLLMSVGSDCHGIESDDRHGDIGDVNSDDESTTLLLENLGFKF